MSDITTTRIFVDGEKGITAAKLNDITASSVIQPAFYTSKPTAGTADPTDIALILKSGAYAQVPISTLGGSATQAQIWSTRLRSFNAIGNCSFEVDQRLSGTSVNFGALSSIDRWFPSKAGSATMGGTWQQIAGAVLLPGTNFAITQSFFRCTLTAQQTTLAAADFLQFRQYVEGPQWRELMSDVHSISLLVRSSAAGFIFGLTLRDGVVTKTLSKLCTIPTANTWTLIQLPNLPIWPSGNFAATPGVNSYQLTFSLASGSSQTSPANDTWQNGNFIGAAGQSNFGALPINSTFDVAFVQHEPGSVCSTLMDKPFTQNFDECLRYFQKTYSYSTAPGAVILSGSLGWIHPNASTANCLLPIRFYKPMAKVPTVVGYSPNTGAAGVVYESTTPANRGISAYINLADGGFSGFTLGTTPPAGAQIQAHYTADTGW